MTEKTGAACGASGFSRRAIVGAAAWSLPTLMLLSSTSASALEEEHYVPMIPPEKASLAVGDESTVLVLRPQADSELARRAENRAVRHSSFQPTGRYVRAGETLTVDAADRTTVELAVGLFGVHAGQNGGVNRGVEVVPGSAAGAVTAPRDGMVFVRYTGDVPLRARITGGTAMPTFVRGETSMAEFRRQLAVRSTAPFVTIVTERVYGDFQYGTVVPHAESVPVVTGEWDELIGETDRVYGLRGDYGGIAHKSANRIYIANPDSGPGYASAAAERLTFQNDTGAGAHLFRAGPDQQWGLWHEIGHTYQTPGYKWSGLGEITVNISALAIQDALGFPNRMDEDARREAVAALHASPLDGRDFDAISDGTSKLVMFDQLRRSFGDDFYPRLNQEYRVRNACGEYIAEPHQTFMRLSSEVAGRNLDPFFRQYGLHPTAPTATAMAALPALEFDIWTNHDRATDVRIDSVAPYTVPTATASTNVTGLTLGQAVLPEATITGARNSDSTGTVGLHSMTARYAFEPERVASLSAVLVNDNGVRNVVEVAELPFSMGTSLVFGGYADRTFAWLALDPASGTLRAGSNHGQIHWYFGDRAYFAVTVTQPDGVEVRASAQGGGVGHSEPFAAALHGVPYEPGTTLTVTHLEPSRLQFWLDDDRQPVSQSSTQMFTVTAGGALSRA